MKLYLLLHEQDTDSAWGSDVTPYTEYRAAQKAMWQAYRASIQTWVFDDTIQTEEHECSCMDDKAVIRDGTEMESWRIEVQELVVQVAVEVIGGLVRSVYSNADVTAEIFDLDVSDFPDEGELNEIEEKTASLEKLKNSTDWKPIW